jgi:thioredoxin-like negative regulator of GroEL
MNNGLLFLTSDDFRIQKREGGDLLVHSIPNFSLVLFYSVQCPHCDQFISAFKRLPGSIKGCQIGMLNVNTNKQCVFKSRETIVPIEYVPFIILYYNGKPSMIYKGPPDQSEIGRFVVETSRQIQVEEPVIQGKTIPAYTIGAPLCGEDGVCYLDYKDAYTPMKK